MFAQRSLFLVLQLLGIASAALITPKVTDPAHGLTYVGVLTAGVENWLNIRYGQDTGGVNRFKHPTAFSYPTGTTVQATKLGPACPATTEQSLFGFKSNGNVNSLSEDCLNLRVARTLGTQSDAKLPVMVWIYGGGDETGSIDDSLYDPTALVLGASLRGEPVIFVSMNYRLNIFGFGNNAALRKEGSLNSGLLDQRLALQWIQNNIALFGGDPSNVMLFGQSDGGTSVGLHMTAYGGTGPVLFQRGIMESGSPVGDPGVSGNTTELSTAKVADIAGCSAVTQAAVLNCLRGLSTTDLLTAVQTYENQTVTQTSQDIFFPVVDGTLIPAAPSQLLKQGKFHKNISIIAGWNYNDGAIFASTSFTSDQQVEGYLMANYPHFTPSTIQTLLTLYPTAEFAYLARAASSPTLTLSPQFFRAAQIYRDVNFACPALYTAAQVASHNAGTGSAKVYLYELNQTAFAALEALGGAAFEGVIHISEVPYVFNDPLAVAGSPADVVLAAKVSGSWAQFAKAGNPVGNTTLAGWGPAKVSANKKGVVQSAEVMVIGGVTPGMMTFGMSGPEMLVKRCEFINGLYGMLQT